MAMAPKNSILIPLHSTRFNSKGFPTEALFLYPTKLFNDLSQKLMHILH